MSSDKNEANCSLMEVEEASDAANQLQPGTTFTFIRKARILSTGEFPAQRQLGFKTNQPIRLRLTGLPSPLPTEMRFYVADRIPKNKPMNGTVVMGPDLDGVYACSVKYRNRDGLEKLLEVEAAKQVVDSSPFASSDVRVSGKGRSVQISSDKEGRSARTSSAKEGHSARSSCSTPWVKGRSSRYSASYSAKNTIQRQKHSRRPFLCPVSGCGLVHDNPKNHLGSHVPRFMTEASGDISPATSAKRQEYLAKLCFLATQDNDLTVAMNMINEARYIQPGYSITQKLRSIMEGVVQVTHARMPENPIKMVPITSPLVLLHTRCLLFLVSKTKRDQMTALNDEYKEVEVGLQVAEQACNELPIV
ncbi:uncharacterized protein LOC117100364 [Anneissia japonica]|uniref:uncharacterized protein LOC117100364 n=1 Tax=Anneissia japonica TaxID=1529436 RepID=UPI0014256F6C|nr:uncharacterized protein LOC117100364 [Anneissia japonica]